MWDDQWEAFGEQYQVIRYDWRGCGRSPMPEQPFSHRADLHALFQQLGVERAVLVGASFGGRTAVQFALDHPEMVDALVLVGAGVGATTPSEQLVQVWDEVEAAMAAGDVERANELELRAWVDGPGRTPQQVDPLVRERVREMNGNNLRLAVDAPEEPLEPPAKDRLHEIGVPVLVIVGDHDQAHVLASAEHFVTHIPQARKVVMEGTAHLPSMEQPERFNRVVLDFLAAQ